MNLNFYKKILKKKLSKFIKKGDTIYVESDLTSFNQIFKKCNSKQQFLDFFYKLFTSLIGKKGTIIVPSFSYSWGDNKKQKIFDLDKSLPKTGIFPLHLKNKKNVYRTIDPMFSCLIHGNKDNYFLTIKNNTFGTDSIFEKLLTNDAKLISFGLKRFDPTFVHYVEQFFDQNIKKINYRYLKKIKGTIVNQNKKYTDNFLTFLKNRKYNKFFFEERIKKDLFRNKKLKEINFFDAKIFIVGSKDFFYTGIKGMKKNVHYFIN